MERSVRKAAVVCAVLAALFTTGACQAVRCFTEMNCAGTESQATDFRECCLGPGLSYTDAVRCRTCVVIGWEEASAPNNTIDSTPLRTALEQSASYSFPVTFLKGTGALIMVQVTPIFDTAVAADILVNSPGTLNVAAGQDAVVEVNLRVDQLAMEPLERFRLRLDPVPFFGPDPATEVFIDELTVEIIDNDNVSIRFTENDYRRPEDIPDGLIPVLVERTAESGTPTGLANPIVIRVIPVPYNVVNETGFPLPMGFPPVDPYDPRAPVRAQSGIDFNASIIIKEFSAGDLSRDLDTSIMIVNDDIDEVDEVFAVLLEVVSAVNPDRVFLDERNASLCRIVDDDDIALSFEFSAYTVSESTFNLPVRVVKEPRGTAQTEITYTFSIEATPVTTPGGQEATEGTDYTLGVSVAFFDIIPVSQNFGFVVQVFDDEDPEGRESFQLVLSSVAGTQQFQLGTFPSATVTIEDNDPVEVGFVENVTVVSESIGSFIQMVSVFRPDEMTTLSLTFFMNLMTVDDSAAGDEDYVRIAGRSNPLISPPAFGDEVRTRNVTVEILDDNRFEEDEVFFLTLSSLPGDESDLTVFPNVSMITIQDDDNVTIGFRPDSYTVDEGTGDMFLVIAVLEGAIGSDITLSVSTRDGTATAGIDYQPLADFQFTMSRDETIALIPVSIIHDLAFELQEAFSASLSLVSPISPRITIAPEAATVTIDDDDAVTIGFRSESYAAQEGDGTVQLVVEILSGQFAAGVSSSVELTLADGTALVTEDYGALPSTILRFDDTTNEHTVPVTIVNDNRAEATETFTGQLSLVSPDDDRVTISPSQTTVTIEDDDQLTVGFAQTSYTVSEGVGVATVAVVITQGSVGLGETVNLQFSTDNDTAFAPQDYTATTQTVSFTSDQGVGTEVTIDIPISDDDVLEEKLKTFLGSLVLQPTGLNVNVVPSQTEVVIQDDDTVVIGFSPDSYIASEDSGSITFTATVLQGSLGRDAVVVLTTSDGTAVAPDDYSSTTQTLTFTPSQSSQTVTVTIINDDLLEINEDFFASLETTDVDVNLSPQSATAVITNDDTAVIGFQPATYSVQEFSGPATVIATVLEGQLGREVVLGFSTVDDSATAPGDYITITNLPLTFNPSTTTNDVMVVIVDDSISEGEEVFSVTLVATEAIDGLTISPESAPVTIIDNDNVTIGFEQGSYTIPESAGTVDVVVRAVGQLSQPVTVTLSTGDGTAISVGPEIDYMTQRMNLVFDSTTTSHTVSIVIINDTRLEFDENFSSLLSLMTTDTSVFLNPEEATITIIDDDRVLVGFEQPTYTTSESFRSVSVAVVVLNGILRRPVVVSMRTEDGTALDGEDYTSSQSDITFDSTTSRFSFAIPLRVDGINEPDEVFNGILSTLDSDVDLSPQTTAITIQDDDDVFFTFSQSVYMFLESAGTGEVCVERIGDTVQTIPIIISGALQQSLGTSIDQVLVFPPNVSQRCVQFPIDDDNIALEEVENLMFSISIDGQFPGAQLGDITSAVVAILDDDELQLTLVKGGDIPEGVGSVQVCVQFDRPFAQPFPIEFRLNATEAQVGEDFVDFRRTITVTLADSAAGQLCFDMEIIDDNVVEQDRECFSITVLLGDTPFEGVIEIINGTQECCIVDDDTVVIGFNPDQYRVPESGGAVSLTVEVLEGELGRPVEVTFNTADGTAIAPGDYISSIPTTLTFSPGQTTRIVTVSVVDDDIQENDEEFSGTLSSTDRAVELNPEEATVLIADNDAVVIGFQPNNTSVSETSGTVTLTAVLISGTLDREIVVEFFTTNATADSPADYTAVTSILTFSPDISINEIAIPIINDNLVEGDEVFFGNLQEIPGSPVTLNPDVAPVTIIDDDRVTIGLERTLYSVSESELEVRVCAVIVSGELRKDATVELSTADGTAKGHNHLPTPPSFDYGSYDYGIYSDTLHFPTGSVVGTQACTGIIILDDYLFEEFNETFLISLTTTDSSVDVNPDSGVVVITDNDFVTIGFDQTLYRVNESAGAAEVCVSVMNRGSVSLGPIEVMVSYSTEDGSATDGTDYIGSSGDLIFPSTDTQHCISITILDDSVLEAVTEVFFANLMTSQPRVRLLPNQTNIDIIDNDGIRIGFVQEQYIVSESDGSATLEVAVLDGQLQGTVFIPFFTQDGSAIDTLDYTSVSQDLTFSSTMTSVTINVPIIDDSVYEADETFTGVLSDVKLGRGIVIFPDVSTVTIEDNDGVTIGIEETSYSVSEDGGLVEVCAVLVSGDLGDSQVTVTIQTRDSSANAPDDYDSLTQQLTFSQAMTRSCVNITIIGDNLFEGNEDFIVDITTTEPRVTLLPNTSIVTIIDQDDIRIGFVQTVYSVSEGVGLVEVCAAVLEGSLATTLPAISFNTQDGSATAPADYTTTTDSFIFSPSAMQHCANIPIVDDLIIETLESFTATLSGPSTPGVFLSPDEAEISIAPNEVRIGFQQTVYMTSEDAGTLEVCAVVYEGAVTTTTVVTATAVDDTAVFGADYTPASFTYSFAPGETQQCFDIAIVSDTTVETEERFSLSLSTTASNVILSPDEAEVVIAPDGAVMVMFAQPSYTYSEDEVFGQVQVIKTGNIRGSFIVRVVGGPSQQTDIVQSASGIDQNITFTETIDSIFVNFDLTDDDVALEPVEQYDVRLELLVDDSRIMFGSPEVTTVNVLDDDDVTVSFGTPSLTVSESDQYFTMCVLKSRPTLVMVTASVGHVPATATSPMDYDAATVPSSVTFQPTDEEMCFNVTIVDDDVGLESSETFSLTLFNPSPSGVGVVVDTSVITIIDNDVVTVSLSTPSVRVNESDGSVQVCVEKNRATSEDITLSLTSQDITAGSDIDYLPNTIPSSITIGANDLQACFEVGIIDDSIALEGDEVFNINIDTVTLPPGITIGNGVSQVTIVDDDVVTVRIEQERYSVPETVGSVEVCVVKDKEVATSFTVTLTTEEVEAEDGLDYIGGVFSRDFLTGSLPANNRVCQDIVIITDALPETDESFLVSLNTDGTPRVVTGQPDVATVVITSGMPLVNDTVVGDPLITVPVYIPQSVLESNNLTTTSQISLCYEIHGQPGQYFNLVTDECASVNARWVDLTDYLNVIDQVGIRAVDSDNRCRNIRVDLDQCATYIDGQLLTTSQFSEGDIAVRKSGNRVRVSVPNCNELNLVMWIFCQNLTMTDPFTTQRFQASMIKFVVMRGLNFGHRMAHGIIGQFWNVPVNLAPYTGLDRKGMPVTNRYQVTVPSRNPASTDRSFTGIYYEFNWSHERKPCLYSGNRQAGPIYEISSPNDPVIEGNYRDYKVPGAFEEEGYKYGLFDEDSCDSDTPSTPV